MLFFGFWKLDTYNKLYLFYGIFAKRTPVVRKAIQESYLSGRELARKYGTSKSSIISIVFSEMIALWSEQRMVNWRQIDG